MLEDAAQKPSDTSESEANDSKPEQPGANEPPTSIEPVPDLDKEKVVSATKPEEDEKSVSVSNSDKDDENVKTTESGDPPTKEDADANTSEQLFHVEQSQEVAKSSIEQAETKPSIGTTADDATQDKVVSGLPSKDSMEEKEETATNAISSSTPKADATLVSPIPTSFSSTQPLQEGTKDAKGFSFLKPQEASMSSVTEASTGTESQSSETPPRFARNAQEISKSGLEHTASSFAMPKEETSNATPAFSFSQISSEKPSFPLSKPAETSSKNPELPSNLASSEKTTQQSFVKKEATPTLSLESGSPEAPKTKPGSNNLAADSDKSLSAPSDMPKASPFSSSFGASASQGLFTKSGNAGVVPAFSALSGTKDERPPMWEGLSIKSQTTQKTDQPCPPVNNAKKNEQTGVSLTTPVPQIDLSKPIVTSAPKQNDELETEFVKIYVTLKEELHALKAHADSCSEFFKKLKQPSSTPKQLDEVKDSKSWVFADKDVLDPVARELAQQLQKGVSEVSTVQHRLDGLESTHLKAEIKKDEIARFLRARQDREFAKLVRIRHLGPEHVENQWRLRRMTHVVRERMQELQDFLNSVQRNSSMVKQGMSAMRAPSLDSTLEQGAIELRQIRQPMQAPQPESKPLELPASEDKPMKATNFLATSTPNGVDYGASTTSPVKPIQSAFRNSTLPLLTSSKGGLVSTSGALPQQYTTFEGLVQPRPVDSETRDLTLEEFVAQEDELDEEEDDDYEDEEDSYNDGYDDYEENDFEDEAD
ncbi:hypothetical protein MCAP1_001232 [Malassezia caprae]|uniref:Uncharacterized protein n=1 Tax=Malassezia caprae TaxID=1381934 RepID=A0AAF0E3W6_9BASI|nr:hypothetical protein MCAP1_001232 [Malassezia caprae]